MMTIFTRIFAIATVLFLAPIQADAQKKLISQLDSMLTARYNHADIDTNYVIRPQTKWTLTGQLKASGTRIRINEREDGNHTETEFDADMKSTLSLNVSYIGLSLSLSINPAKLLGKYRDTELTFRSYGKRFGFDLTFHDASNFKGYLDSDGIRREFISIEGRMNVQTLNMNAYYAFNHRRFSYPAAFSHNYIQRRSTGSILLAASMQAQQGKMNGDGNNIDFSMGSVGIGAGYGYNFVPGHGWLIHISCLPTLVVSGSSTFTSNDTSETMKRKFPEYILTTRSAVVKQLGKNMFAGLSSVYTLTRIGCADRTVFRNYKWITHLYFGYRL